MFRSKSMRCEAQIARFWRLLRPRISPELTRIPKPVSAEVENDGVLYTLTEQNFFAALSLTFRGHEAGLFHPYGVISSCEVYVSTHPGFYRCFLTEFDRRRSLP